MAPIVDMSDKHAWDDSLLISSWDEALNEYKVKNPLAMQHAAEPCPLTRAQKYHSIHQSGKKLEDVLTEEELKELRE